MTEKHTSTLVINPSGGQESGASKVVVSTTSSGSFSQTSTMSKSSSTSQGANTSSSTKSTSTTKVTKSSSTSVKKMSMSSTTIKSSSSSNIAIKSSGDMFSDVFGRDFGIDVNKEMDKLKLTMGEEVQKARSEMFSLMKLEKLFPDEAGTGTDLIKLDSKSVMDYVDKAHGDRLKFNFAVDEFESESINVKAVGNQIEVHGVKKSRKGDDETSEEFSRSYELPTQDAIDSSSVTSSFYKDGVLSIELPFDTKKITI